MQTAWIDCKCVCLSFQCTHRVQGPVCGKCLDDDLSGCKNTISCLLWWMSNTRTAHTVFSISKLSLWLSAAQPLPSPTVIPARFKNCNSKTVSGQPNHPLAHTRGHARKPKPLLLLYPAGAGFTQQWKSLWHSHGRNEGTRGEGEQDLP